METVHIPWPTSEIIFFALLGPGRNPVGQGACPRAFGGVLWGQHGPKIIVQLIWKNILNPRRGRTAGNSPNICKTSKGQNKVCVFFSSHQHNFYMCCMDITWNHGVMCKENFVDLCHWHQGWFGPCAGSIRHARSGDVRGRLRWLHSVGLKLYQLPALYHFVPM